MMIGVGHEARAGWSVAGPGDLNGDRFAEVAVGASGAGVGWLVSGPLVGGVMLGKQAAVQVSIPDGELGFTAAPWKGRGVWFGAHTTAARSCDS